MSFVPADHLISEISFRQLEHFGLRFVIVRFGQSLHVESLLNKLI